MEQKVKIGIVARCDNSGLGVMTFDFFRNFFVEKVLIVAGGYQNYFDRFEGFEGTSTILCEKGIPSIAEIDQFLEGLDMVVAFETPYNWNLFSRARAKGIKSILIPMFEWTPEKDSIPCEPDLYLCPSELDYKVLWEPKKMIPTPVNRELVPYRERTEAKTFIFNNGHGGYAGRNSLSEFMQAIPFVKSNVKFKIRSQVYLEPINDTRIELEMGDLPYENLWNDGDVYIHAHKWDGLSLPLNEAMAAGIPIIAPNTEPHNTFLPKELLFDVSLTDPFRLTDNAIPVRGAIIDPRVLAAKIDEVAQMPSEKIKELSQKSNELANARSWSVLKPEFLNIFHELCGKK